MKKCLVWDLDNTIWDGVFLEGRVRVKSDVVTTIVELDRRGILHSIASRGDEDLAMKNLKYNNLEEFFLVPQINWLPKSQNIITISKKLELSLDAMAFVDDDRFEREQVAFMLPEVLTIESEKAQELPGRSEFSPGLITQEARERRRIYQTELDRQKSERSFRSRDDFLKSCKMKMTIRQMTESDIPRVLELMTRTHQLNTTGLIFDEQELHKIFRSAKRATRILVADLEDKFGWYGTIGTAMIETQQPSWRLKYLAVSCRVMGRGIERAFLASMVRNAVAGGFENLEAEFHETGRNKMLRALYQMMGFRAHDAPNESGPLIFRATIEDVPKSPRWIEVL